MPGRRDLKPLSEAAGLPTCKVLMVQPGRAATMQDDANHEGWLKYHLAFLVTGDFQAE